MDNEGEFKPFVPPTPMFDQPVVSRDTIQTLPTTSALPPKMRERKPCSPSPAAGGDKPPKIPPAPKHERPTRRKAGKTKKLKKTIDKAFKTTAKAINENLYGDKKKKRSPAKGGRTLKLDMASAMAISAALKPTDFKMFETIVELLQTANKATRRRLLAAVGKVFG